MQRFAWVGGILVLILVLPVSAKPKKNNNKKMANLPDAATVQEYMAVEQAGGATGKLTGFDPATMDLSLTVDVPSAQANAGKGGGQNPEQALVKEEEHMLRRQEEIQRAELKVQQSKTRQELAKNLQALAKLEQQTQRQAIKPAGGGKAYKVATQPKEFEFHVADGVKVRLAELPERYDEKGELKPYTAAEQRERKGTNKALPGYEAKIEDLESGQTIAITLAPRKKTPAKPVAKDADKDADNVPDKVDNKPEITMIVIQKPAPMDTAAKGGKK